MQNDPPALSCGSCKKAASVICSQCGDTTCSPRSKKHTCVVDKGDDYILMPLVNSPLAEVCGYEDPRSQKPHGHVPGVTNPDGTPWLPIY